MEEGGRPAGAGTDDRDLLGQAGPEGAAEPLGAAGPARPGRPRRRGLAAFLWWGLGVLKAALEVAVLAAVLWLFVFQVSVVSGSSMYPSLESDDKLVVDKFSYFVRSIRRFDVVVFECPTREGRDYASRDYVKRVVGLPGETVELRHGELFVNGERVDQDFDYVDDGGCHGPVTVPEGRYFVLGDNRPQSRDSRADSIGLVPKRLIKGIVRFRVYPFGRAGSL